MSVENAAHVNVEKVERNESNAAAFRDRPGRALPWIATENTDENTLRL